MNSLNILVSNMRFLYFFLLFVSISQSSFAKNNFNNENSKKDELNLTISNGFADIVEEMLPAVVNISTTQTSKNSTDISFIQDLPDGHPFSEIKDRIQKNPSLNSTSMTSSVGSGFLVDSDGYIVTNFHVIDQAKEISVALNDGTKYKGKLIGFDEKTDLALLKIDSKKLLPTAKFGDSSKARVGEWVIAVGNPYGLGSSVSLGIISANKRSVNQMDGFIQTDAAINKGNSGGPLFNIKGEVIGVNSALYSPSGVNIGIGFANPSNSVESIIKQLKVSGEVMRPWIGMSVQNIDKEIAQTLNLKKWPFVVDKKIVNGVYVIEVSKESPAFFSKIYQGDIIIKFENKYINEMKELPEIVSKQDIGKDVSVIILRDNKLKKILLKIGKTPERILR